MTAQDVMSVNVKRCSPDTDLAAASAMMWDHDCGALPVVEDGRLVGIITDRDICIALGTRDRPAHEVTVREVQTTKLEVCHPRDELHHAMELMRCAKVRRLPVVNRQGVLQGVLSLNDLALRVDHAHGEELSYEQVMNTIKAVGEHRSHKLGPSGHARVRVATAS